MNLDNWPYKQHELLKTAMEATDDYLGVEKHTMEHFKAGMKVPSTALHDFTFHMSRAHDALQTLGVLDQHEDYMTYHVQQMAKMHGHDDSTLSDLPGTHVPTADTGEVEENVKVKSFSDFLKESKEEKKNLGNEEEISDDEIEKMVNGLEWEDIADFYSSDELEETEEDEEDEEELEEAISASSRLKRRQQFARFKARRNIAKGMKLRRASDPATLQKRAKLAARRALYRRFLKGRNKSQLSAAEKDRLEAQVSRLKNVMSTIAQRMMPKIRQIEQKRLARLRTRK